MDYVRKLQGLRVSDRQNIHFIIYFSFCLEMIAHLLYFVREAGAFPSGQFGLFVNRVR